MRLISTICSLMISLKMIGQLPAVNESNPFEPKQTDVKIKIRCLPTSKVSPDPLLIIDGVPVEFEKLQSINPDDIESIHILQTDTLKIVSCKPNNGVILITTKRNNIRRFQINDVINGNNIPRATATFISSYERQDTLRFVANDSGIITTDKLRVGVEYQLTITSIGYKPLSVAYRNVKQQSETFSMEKDIREFAPVVVKCDTEFGCIRTISCGLQRITICSFQSRKEVSASPCIGSYPNPVRKNSSLTVEMKNANDGNYSLQLISLAGQIVLSKETGINKSEAIAKLDIRNIPSGAYILQMINKQSGKKYSEKVIVE